MISTDYEADVRRAARDVVRRFQYFTPGQRANAASSHRLGRRQVMAIGSAYYTHPDVPGRGFDTRTAAARAAVDAQILAVLLWWQIMLDRFRSPGARVALGRMYRTGFFDVTADELAEVTRDVAATSRPVDGQDEL